jgi:tagatose 1,6-diphosphate aldolase
MSPGKLTHLKKLSDSNGIIAAAAMDQRGSLKKAIAAAQGSTPDQVTDKMMEDFKTAVTKVLTPHATAILLDPEWGLPAAKARAKNAGLLLAYEHSGYDNTKPGRLPDLLPHVSVKRIQDWCADAVKILIYYTPFDPADINDIKHAFIERIGAECDHYQIPFFLEFVGYHHEGKGEKSLEYAKMKPKIVIESMKEFSQPKYNVDVLKVEVPIIAEYVEGSRMFKGEKAYSKSEAMTLFRDAAAVATRPFIYLSAGVDNETFTEQLALATESGTDFSGVLCGRATWKDGISVFGQGGMSALEEWLSVKGVENIGNVNNAIKGATPWWVKLGLKAQPN